MAKKPICKIPECGNPNHSKGWCGVHYQRWVRHGDPLKITTATNGEPLAYYRDVVLKYEGDECLIWPFAKVHGYGNIFLEGKSRVVSRLVCAEVNGEPPEEKMDAAHSCGNGHLACVTKAHMSWKTRSGNIADMVEHGTARRGEKNHLSKLTEAQVIEILALKGTATHREIGAKYGVAGNLVTRIYSGARWGHLSR
jgi:hypothetical protein